MCGYTQRHIGAREATSCTKGVLAIVINKIKSSTLGSPLIITERRIVLSLESSRQVKRLKMHKSKDIDNGRRDDDCTIYIVYPAMTPSTCSITAVLWALYNPDHQVVASPVDNLDARQNNRGRPGEDIPAMG